MNKYKNVLLISEDLLKSITNIDSNLSPKFILPAIRLAQDNELKQILGEKLLNKIKSLIYTKEIDLLANDKYKELLIDYIQIYVCYATIKHILYLNGFKIANLGVLRTDDEKANNISQNEINVLKSYYDNIANNYKYDLQEYLRKHRNDFPELTCKSNLFSASNSVLWLGGERGR